jgi:hypothetical protein
LPVLAARAAGAPTSSPTTNKEAEAKMKDWNMSSTRFRANPRNALLWTSSLSKLARTWTFRGSLLIDYFRPILRYSQIVCIVRSWRSKNEAWHMYAWDMAHVCINHGTCSFWDACCSAHLSHTWMSHGTCIHESWHMHE